MFAEDVVDDVVEGVVGEVVGDVQVTLTMKTTNLHPRSFIFILNLASPWPESHDNGSNPKTVYADDAIDINK